MSCADSIKSTWAKCCCCTSETKIKTPTAQVETTEQSRIDQDVVTTEPPAQRKENVNDEPNGRSLDVDVSSDPEDPEKYRYSGRNFDVINLDETSSEKNDHETKKVVVTRIQIPDKRTKSALFKFTSTRRGAKNESVYTKTTKF